MTNYDKICHKKLGYRTSNALQSAFKWNSNLCTEITDKMREKETQIERGWENREILFASSRLWHWNESHVYARNALLSIAMIRPHSHRLVPKSVWTQMITHMNINTIARRRYHSDNSPKWKVEDQWAEEEDRQNEIGTIELELVRENNTNRVKEWKWTISVMLLLLPIDVMDEHCPHNGHTMCTHIISSYEKIFWFICGEKLSTPSQFVTTSPVERTVPLTSCPPLSVHFKFFFVEFC